MSDHKPWEQILMKHIADNGALPVIERLDDKVLCLVDGLDMIGLTDEEELDIMSELKLICAAKGPADNLH